MSCICFATKLLQAAERTQHKTHGRRPFTMRRPTARRDVALILLLLDTGLRASKCARLTLGDLKKDTGNVMVRPYLSGLKSRPRIVYLSTRARKALWRYMASRGDVTASDAVFAARQGPINRHSIRRVLSRLGERCGVSPCGPHRFRHTTAIRFLRNCGYALSLQRMLGHASLDMVRRPGGCWHGRRPPEGRPCG